MDGVWEAVRTRTDYAALVPRPRTDIERADLRKRDGTPYTVLKNPAGDSGAGTYVRLEGPDVELYELMDGRRTTSEIIVEYLERNFDVNARREVHFVVDLKGIGKFLDPNVSLGTK